MIKHENILSIFEDKLIGLHSLCFSDDRKSDLEDSPHGKQQSRRSSSRKIEVGKSHSRSLSSLGEITVERKSSELQCWTSRVLSQVVLVYGIIII